MTDLFQPKASATTYTASDIEVLEGLEPVRKRPGMYIGGTDTKALHHLVAEVVDNAIDEVVAGFASKIVVHVMNERTIAVQDNGRGIPIDPHPKYPSQSACEVIFTTLHSGGKFKTGAYETAGGLHGVGLSVVNALSSQLDVAIVRGRTMHQLSFSRGKVQSPMRESATSKAKGTTITFTPDEDIFSSLTFNPKRLFHMIQAKAFLVKGVEIIWKCDIKESTYSYVPPKGQSSALTLDPKNSQKTKSDTDASPTDQNGADASKSSKEAPASLIQNDKVPHQYRFFYPNGLCDYMHDLTQNLSCLTLAPFAENISVEDPACRRVEWSVCWPEKEGMGEIHSFCNTIPTPLGGTHEQAFRTGLARALRAAGEKLNIKKTKDLSVDDICLDAMIFLSIFMEQPQFQGQTKEKLTSTAVARVIENTVKDHVEHWLSLNVDDVKALLEALVERYERKQAQKVIKEIARSSVTQRLRLPGKLADCSSTNLEETEIFLVEGDSAGGSAKQARNRKTQAILPLRGKILNVASASLERMKQNQEIKDLTLAIGCGLGSACDSTKRRYGKIIIMTDADVDGAHIASLLMTFFLQQMTDLLIKGCVYLAQPPLYRITLNSQTYYAAHEKERDAIVKKMKGKPQVGRFKGLGEMMPAQLRDTTMHPERRSLLKVHVPHLKNSREFLQKLMGKNPEERFTFIQENSTLEKVSEVLT